MAPLRLAPLRRLPMKILSSRLLVFQLCAFCALLNVTRAEDVFYVAKVKDLVKEDQLPGPVASPGWPVDKSEAMTPYVLLDGAGEAYLKDKFTANGNWYSDFKNVKLVVRAPERRDISGRILVPTDKYRSEEHTSELQSRGLISYAVFC